MPLTNIRELLKPYDNFNKKSNPTVLTEKLLKEDNEIKYSTIEWDNLLNYVGGEDYLIRTYFGNPEGLTDFLLKKQEEYSKEFSNMEYKYLSIPYMDIKHYSENIANDNLKELISYAGGKEYLKTNFEIPELLKNYLLEKQEELLNEKDNQDPTIEHLGSPYKDIKKLSEQIIANPDYPLYMLKHNSIISKLHERFLYLKDQLKNSSNEYERAMTKEHMKDIIGRMDDEIEDMILDYDIESINTLKSRKDVINKILILKPLKINVDYKKEINNIPDKHVLLDILSNTHIRRLTANIKNKLSLLDKLSIENENGKNNAQINKIEEDVDFMKDELKTYIDDYAFRKDIYFNNAVAIESLLDLV